MFVVVLGTHGSGSTWAFNVVRALLAVARPAAVGLYSETAQALLHDLPLGARDVVLKAHWLDRPLLKLLEVAGASVIVTDRQPQDSAVSQQDRFGLSYQHVLRDLSRSYASTAMARALTSPLVLQYEDRFFDDPQTIRAIADHLGVTPDDALIEAIFSRLEFGAVRSQLDKWSGAVEAGSWARVDPAEPHDPATQLHPGHVGDGVVGKGKQRLPPEQYQVIADAFARFREADSWRTRPMRWSSACFIYGNGREAGEPEVLELEGNDDLIVYGPYFHLPAGRWKATPLIRTEQADIPVSFRVDVHTISRGVVQLHTIRLPSANRTQMQLEFDHLDHDDPVEVRISSVTDGRRRRLIFSGVELSWIGACDPEPGHARPVEQHGVLGL